MEREARQLGEFVIMITKRMCGTKLAGIVPGCPVLVSTDKLC